LPNSFIVSLPPRPRTSTRFSPTGRGGKTPNQTTYCPFICPLSGPAMGCVGPGLAPVPRSPRPPWQTNRKGCAPNFSLQRPHFSATCGRTTSCDRRHYPSLNPKKWVMSQEPRKPPRPTPRKNLKHGGPWIRRRQGEKTAGGPGRSPPAPWPRPPVATPSMAVFFRIAQPVPGFFFPPRCPLFRRPNSANLSWPGHLRPDCASGPWPGPSCPIHDSDRKCRPLPFWFPTHGF